jgi:hypothetical protein
MATNPPVPEAPKPAPMLELGIEFSVEVLLFLWQNGAEQMNLPHNFWLGFFSWVVGAILAVRMFWIFPLWSARLSRLEKGLISLIALGGLSLILYRPLLAAYKSQNTTKISPKPTPIPAPQPEPKVSEPPKIALRHVPRPPRDTKNGGITVQQAPSSVASVNQSGGITAGTINVNLDRRLTESAALELARNLRNSQSSITVLALGAGGEPSALADQLLSVIKISLPSKNAVSHAIGFSPFNGVLLKHSISGPQESLDAIKKALTASQIAFEDTPVPSQQPGTIYIFVGYHP